MSYSKLKIEEMMNFSSSFSITEIVEIYYKGRIRVTEKKIL